MYRVGTAKLAGTSDRRKVERFPWFLTTLSTGATSKCLNSLHKEEVLHRDGQSHTWMDRKEAFFVKKPSKKKPSTRRSNRLTQADLQALELLDRLVAEDRRIEQQYNLPFRNPRQVATTTHQCAHCRQNLVLLVFGDLATDIAGLEAYGRLMDELIQRTKLPTYIIAPPSTPGDLDGPALLLKVYPEREEAGRTTPAEWEQLIGRLSDEHCQRP